MKLNEEERRGKNIKRGDKDAAEFDNKISMRDESVEYAGRTGPKPTRPTTENSLFNRITVFSVERLFSNGTLRKISAEEEFYPDLRLRLLLS